MWPVIASVNVGGVERPIGGYGVMLALALLIGGVTFVRGLQREGIDLGRAIALTAVVIGASLGSAHVLFAIVERLSTGQWPWASGRFGVVFYGGAIGGALALWSLARAWTLPFALLADASVWPLALGHALGRVGCLLGGCCFGVEWHGIDGHGTLTTTFTHPLSPASIETVPRVPVQLIEACGVLLLAWGLLRARAQRRLAAAGALASAYALGYAALRLGTEVLRDDRVRGVMFDGAMSTSQLLSVVTLFGAWFVLLRRGRVSALGVLSLLLAVASVWTVSDTARAQLTMQAAAIVPVDAGWFVMGSDDEDIDAAIALCRMDADRPDICRVEAFADERPAQRVYVSAFRIDRTEVSHGDYRRCVSANVCAPSRVSDADPRIGAPSQPVTGVTFHDAQRYCAWRGGRLPTEAQWEKAARGTTARRFPWGNLWNSRLANHGRGLGDEDPIDGYNHAAPVDAFVDARSPYGVLNMAGNVAELITDYYDERGYVGAERMDPKGPEQGSERVVRGGSWRSPAFTLRVTHRTHIGENDTQPDVGFRCSYAP